MIELSEQTVIDKLVDRLSEGYPAIEPATVASVIRDVHARYEGRPLREYIPLFVERNAKYELNQLSVTG